MTKNDFLKELEKGLSGLPKNDISERLDFYGEMIDDRMEEGFTESDAVAACGSVDEIVSQTLNDIPLKKIVKERLSKRKKIGGSGGGVFFIRYALGAGRYCFCGSVILCARRLGRVRYGDSGCRQRFDTNGSVVFRFGGDTYRAFRVRLFRRSSRNERSYRYYAQNYRRDKKALGEKGGVK